MINPIQPTKSSTKSPFLSTPGINVALMFKIMNAQQKVIEEILTGRVGSTPGISSQDLSRGKENVQKALSSISKTSSAEDFGSLSADQQILIIIGELEQLRMLKESSLESPDNSNLKQAVEDLENKIKKQIPDIPPGMVFGSDYGSPNVQKVFSGILYELQHGTSKDRINSFWKSTNLSKMFSAELASLIQGNSIDFSDPQNITAILYTLLGSDDLMGKDGSSAEKILGKNNPALNGAFYKMAVQFLVAQEVAKYGSDPEELKKHLNLLVETFSAANFNKSTSPLGTDFLDDLFKYTRTDANGHLINPIYPLGVLLNQLSFALAHIPADLWSKLT